MDFEDMDVRQLQQACRDRGLPTARDKATMVGRLSAAGAAPAADMSAQEQPAAAPPLPSAPGVWQEQYPAGGFLGDVEHRANCAAVVAAAQAAGYRTAGPGRRARTTGAQHVYEVFVR